MRASDIVEMLSEDDIFSLLEHLGAEPVKFNNHISALTICHPDGHSHKLWYWYRVKRFECFTECGKLGNVFQFLMHLKGWEFSEAYWFIVEYFNIDISDNTERTEKIDQSFFKKFKKKEEIEVLKSIDKKILNHYYNIYSPLWIEDGISIEAMKEFGIRFSIADHQIIIPHYSENGRLVGIRCRNLDEERAKENKYMPVYYQGKFLSHSTGGLLYGLNINKKRIKKHKTIILFEAEKSVLQLRTMDKENSIGVALSGSTLTSVQVKIILGLIAKYGVEEVVIALDKEYKEVGDDEYIYYQEKINRVFIDQLINYVNVSIVWDMEGKIGYKESPTDRGLDTWQYLYYNRIKV